MGLTWAEERVEPEQANERDRVERRGIPGNKR
jgi:hypothetical protein